MQLLDYLLQACLATGVDLTVLGLDAAAARQQLVVLQQAPALLMALADGPDGFEIGGIEIDADLLGSHGQRLERTAQDLTDLAGVAVQLALHHLAHHGFHQLQQHVLDLLVLIADRLHQMGHQRFQLGHPGFQTRPGLLLGLELAGMETVTLAGGKALVIGLGADLLQFLDGEGFDLGFLGYLFDRRGLHLRFRLGLGLVFPGHVMAVQIETGQVPEVEGLHPVGADQIAVILVTHAPVYPLSVLPRSPCLWKHPREHRPRPEAGPLKGSDAPAYQIISSAPLPPRTISPASAMRRAMVRISFCAASTSLMRTGPLASRSSCSSSDARLDMLRKILSLTSSSAPLSATTSTSLETSRSSSWMPRSSTSARLSNTNIRSSILFDRSSSISRIASISCASVELSR